MANQREYLGIVGNFMADKVLEGRAAGSAAVTEDTNVDFGEVPKGKYWFITNIETLDNSAHNETLDITLTNDTASNFASEKSLAIIPQIEGAAALSNFCPAPVAIVHEKTYLRAKYNFLAGEGVSCKFSCRLVPFN